MFGEPDPWRWRAASLRDGVRASPSIPPASHVRNTPVEKREAQP
jgi:hypothetical protein